jgi:hypothetical protein
MMIECYGVARGRHPTRNGQPDKSLHREPQQLEHGQVHHRGDELSGDAIRQTCTKMSMRRALTGIDEIPA